MTLFSFPVWELVIKIVLYHWCSPMNFPKFFASYISQNPFGWLIPLYLRRCQYKIVNIKSYKRIDRKFIYYFIFKFKHDFVTWNIKIRRYWPINVKYITFSLMNPVRVYQGVSSLEKFGVHWRFWKNLSFSTYVK